MGKTRNVIRLRFVSLFVYVLIYVVCWARQTEMELRREHVFSNQCLGRQLLCGPHPPPLLPPDKLCSLGQKKKKKISFVPSNLISTWFSLSSPALTPTLTKAITTSHPFIIFTITHHSFMWDHCDILCWSSKT